VSDVGRTLRSKYEQRALSRVNKLKASHLTYTPRMQLQCPHCVCAAVVVVSGPRGLGREALVTRLLQEDKGAVREPVWCTSRPQRAGERDGIDYHFLTPMK
jgi:Guanylate kinase